MFLKKKTQGSVETSVEHDKVLEQVVLFNVVALPKCLRPLSPSCICCHFFPGLSGISPSDAVSHYSPSLFWVLVWLAEVQAKRYKQKQCTQQIDLLSTQQTQHVGQFIFWWRNIHLVKSLLYLQLTSSACPKQVCTPSASSLSFFLSLISLPTTSHEFQRKGWQLVERTQRPCPC